MINRKRSANGIRHKFNAKSVTDDSHFFHSKAEHRYYAQLSLRQRAGEILFFLRQVPLHLPGGVKYVVDFVEFLASGEVVFTDVKGMETESFKTKKKIVEALYPIEINVVKK